MGDAKDFFYELLNIPKHSTVHQIQQAYTTLIRTCHPDKHPLSSKHHPHINFKSITQAYEVGACVITTASHYGSLSLSIYIYSLQALVGEKEEEEASTRWKQTYSMLRNQKHHHR